MNKKLFVLVLLPLVAALAAAGLYFLHNTAHASCAQPCVNVTPTSLIFPPAVQGGPNPPSQKIKLVEAKANNCVDWGTQITVPWLAVTPPSGTKCNPPDGTLPVSVNIAGLTQGTYTGIIRVYDPSYYDPTTNLPPPAPINVPDSAMDVSVTVTILPPSPTGTINVSSTNSANAQPVKASWDVLGSLGDNYTSTNVSKATYTNVPSENYNLVPVTNSAGAGYALRSVEREVARVNEGEGGMFSKIFTSIKDFFTGGIANAVTTCGAVNTAVNLATNCPANSFSIASAGDTINFVILWDPIAYLSVTLAVPLNIGNGYSVTASVANNGTQGSTLGWNVSNLGSLPAWLKLSKTSGGPVAAGSSDSVTISANTGGLAAGNTYLATVNIDGKSTNITGDPSTNPKTRSINVTLTIPAAGPVTISITPPPPTTVAVNIPVQVSCTGGTGSYTWATDAPAGTYTFSSTNSVSGSAVTVTFNNVSSPIYHVTCTEVGGSGGSASTAVTVTTACTISASPTFVIPPQQSTLSWSCVPGTAVPNSCSISGVGSNRPTNGNASVAPAANTTYVLTCTANNGLGSTMSAFTTVSVKGPGIHETNP